MQLQPLLVRFIQLTIFHLLALPATDIPKRAMFLLSMPVNCCSFPPLMNPMFRIVASPCSGRVISGPLKNPNTTNKHEKAALIVILIKTMSGLGINAPVSSTSATLHCSRKNIRNSSHFNANYAQIKA